ncbi:MAG TPA: CGNR zinc finger domain-containing protein [Actinomycetota bacterium]|nr:CGNR zinc finger domain-containing protein [Actinomycetota bacterium]
MDFTHYTDHSVQAAADLVNTRGSTTGNEYMGTPEQVAKFLAEHDFRAPHRVTKADIAQLHDLRDRLRDVFLSEDEKKAARILNQLLEELDVMPYLTDHDGDWHIHYAPEDASLGRRVAAATAMGLATVISTYGFDRLGVCAADNCKDVFVDMSRNKSRRFCNDICCTRMNVAAYRARAKQKA